MHQNLAIILQLFCYGKISFMGLVPDPIRCRSFRSVLRSTRGLWGRFCSSDRVGPHPEVLQILHLNWKVSWTLAANLDRWCRLPLPSLSFFFFFRLVSKQKSQFFCNKSMWKNVQFKVLGLEHTHFRTWVSSQNH